MLGLMGFSGSLPLYVIHRYYIFVFIDRANKDACLLSSTVPVADGHDEVVDAFVYLGCLIDSDGSRGEVLCRIGLARSCMNML